MNWQNNVQENFQNKNSVTSSGEAKQVDRSVYLTVLKQGGLGQLASTAICGNDIMSSCL